MITSLVTSASGGEGAATFRGRPGFPVLIFRGRPRFFFLGAGSAGAAVASCFTGSKPFSGDLRNSSRDTIARTESASSSYAFLACTAVETTDAPQGQLAAGEIFELS